MPLEHYTDTREGEGGGERHKGRGGGEEEQEEGEGEGEGGGRGRGRRGLPMYREIEGEDVILEKDPTYVLTEDDIEQYASWLGMDLELDSHLFWIARAGLMTELPEDWKPCKSPDGEVYYFNFASGESQWDHPCDEEFRELYREQRQASIIAAQQRYTHARARARMHPHPHTPPPARLHVLSLSLSHSLWLCISLVDWRGQRASGQLATSSPPPAERWRQVCVCVSVSLCRSAALSLSLTCCRQGERGSDELPRRRKGDARHSRERQRETQGDVALTSPPLRAALRRATRSRETQRATGSG